MKPPVHAIELDGDPLCITSKYGFIAYGSEDGSFQLFAAKRFG